MLLDDIIQLATDDQKSIVVLLRHCIVLAHRLKNEPLQTWADKELNGYSKDDELPVYRVTTAHAKGHFIGPGWSEMHGVLIPPSSLDEGHGRFAGEASLTQGIGAYEDLVKQAGNKKLTMPWPSDLVAHYQGRIMDSMLLQSAYQEIPKSSVVELLDTVRTRVLNVALEIQSEVGEDDQDLKHVEPATESRINQTIVQHIYGGYAFVSTGHSMMTVQQQDITNNWENLEGALHASGLSKPDLEELSNAIDRDGKQMGSGVTGWITKTAPKIISGGVKVGATVGQALLTEYLKQYFGLPT